VKRSLWLIIGISAICVVVLLVLYLDHRSCLPIDKEACDRIQRDMTRAEVEAIVGGPPGNYTGVLFKKDITVPLTVAGSASRQQWTGTRGVLIVFFDKQERVMTSMYFPPP
jgi:hypothetical protein